jgi:predicted DNA-binding protein with PD1-like motif
VTIGVHRSDKSRLLVLRVSAGDPIPEALATTLRDERVSCGWLRGSGVLTDVELRAYDPSIGTHGSARRIEGPVQALVLEGTIGLSDGELSLSIRALLSRESDSGLETLSGEIGGARAVAVELLVTALEDVALTRTLDEAAGVWLLGQASAPTAARAARTHSPPSSEWSAALEASDLADREPRKRAPAAAASRVGAAIPARPPRAGPDLDTPFPEAGDAVDHFAFGRCDVLKSDGDRLHVKVHKDGRIREIVLSILRVSRMPDSEDGRRRFKLERRM